ncbi:MAG: hypothetical protein GPW18_05100 [Euryarchaeota archaeon]|jgi:hypothetical protein|nr:hypothetical protein [Euryarchaeota archaeon]
MTEININQDVFNWFLDKAKSLQPPKMSIKVGPYIFTLKYVWVKAKLGNQVAEDVFKFRSIDPNVTPCELANISALEFYVKVLYDRYDIIVEFHRDGNVYKMHIDRGVDKEDIDKILNAINIEISENSEVNRKNYLIIELNDVINYLNEVYDKAHEEDEDEYTVYIDEMPKKAIKPLMEILSYLVGDEE